MNINGVGNSLTMPINCGMPGMHGNAAKDVSEKQSTPQNNSMLEMHRKMATSAADKQNMPENCGMHDEVKSKPDTKVNSDFGNILDARA